MPVVVYVAKTCERPVPYIGHNCGSQVTNLAVCGQKCEGHHHRHASVNDTCT